MKIVGVTEVRTRFGAYLDIAQKEPIIITRRGWPVAILIGVNLPPEAHTDAIRAAEALRQERSQRR